MQPTIIFFDLDSTLIENQFSRKVIGKVLGEIADTADIPLEELGRAMAEENTRRQRQTPDHPLTMDWSDIVEQLAQRHEVTLEDDLDALWNSAALAEDVEILDDAPQVLQRLQAAHRRLVVATKGLSKYQKPVLKASGLDQYFDDILTPDITGHLKTSPQYFDKYIKQEALFVQVGDHYYDDVICAKRNGFYAVLRAPIKELKDYDPFERSKVLEQYLGRISTYPAEGTHVRPDAMVYTLQEVPDVIQQLEKGTLQQP